MASKIYSSFVVPWFTLKSVIVPYSGHTFYPRYRILRSEPLLGTHAKLYLLLCPSSNKHGSYTQAKTQYLGLYSCNNTKHT